MNGYKFRTNILYKMLKQGKTNISISLFNTKEGTLDKLTVKDIKDFRPYWSSEKYHMIIKCYE